MFNSMQLQNEVTMKIKDAFASRHEPESAKVLGEVFWVFLVSILILATVGGIAVGVREFLTPHTQVEEESVSVGSRKTITKTEIVKILEMFDVRAQEYETRRVAPVSARDPS